MAESQKPIVAYTPLRDLNHAPDISQALGNVIVAWSFAEGFMVDVLRRALDTEHVKASSLFHTVPNFRGRVSMINRMCAEFDKDPERVAAIKKALGKLNKLSKRRNDLVHGVWSRRWGGDETVIFDHRELPHSTGRRKPIKAHELEQHAEKVRNCALELMEANQIGTP